MSDKEKHNRRNQDEAMEEKWEISASRCSDCMCDGFYVSMCRQGRTEKTSANAQQETVPVSGTQQSDISMETIPEYDGEPYVVIDDNEPNFTEEELQPEAYETYGTLDALGRCSTAEASIGEGLMPTEKRGAIGQVKPTGWHTVKYDMVEGKYLYNRCHLIGYQLTAENANEKNLITGTRYMNTEGMLPFENMVADYIKETGNHVMYVSHRCLKGKILWHRECRWKQNRWKIREQIFPLMYMCIMYSREWRLIIKPEKAGRQTNF